MFLPDLFIMSLIYPAGGTALELVGDGERQSWVSRLRGLMFFFLFYYPAFLISVWLFRELATIVVLKPRLILDFRPVAVSDNLLLSFFGIVVLPFSSVLLGDFLYYWFHRLQHAVPPLWRFHAVHHAIEELNVVNSNHHFTEDLFKVPFISAPIVLVQFQQGPHAATLNIIIATLYAVVLTLVHANSRISFGPLNYVITRPLYHRIHHSLNVL